MFARSGRIRALAAIAMAGAVLTWSVGASALSIVGLYDTGEGASVGSADLHYSMSGPTSTTKVLVGHPVWVSAPAGWIGPNNGDSSAAAGSYVYSLSFDLVGMDLDTASISGSWAADNNAEIFLNGVSTGHSLAFGPPYSFEALTAFSLDSGFVDGTNVLAFHVENPGPGPSPTGLLVTNLTGSVDLMAVPEPGAALLIGSGLLVLGALRRSR